MPNKRRAGVASTILRLSAEEKERLMSLVTRLNRLRPEANYTASGVIRAALLDRMAKLEEELLVETCNDQGRGIQERDKKG